MTETKKEKEKNKKEKKRKEEEKWKENILHAIQIRVNYLNKVYGHEES